MKGLDREYINKMADHPILSQEEEVRLAKLKDRGDKSARETLICHNIRLVLSLLPRYTGRGLPEDDLIQEGLVGLIAGVDRYEWQRGYKLSTYATFWVRQALGRALPNQARIIRLPVHMFDQASKLCACRDFLRVQGGEDNLDEVAAEIGISPERARKILEFNRLSMPVSLDYPLFEDEVTSFDFIADDSPPVANLVEDLDCQRVITDILEDLPPRTRKILEMRFGLNGQGGATSTLDIIGQKFGITRERARQIEAEALTELRSNPVIRGRLEALL